MPSAREEARPFLLPLYVISFLLVTIDVLWPWTWPVTVPLVGIVLLLILFIWFFFRDPERKVPDNERFIVAAADGRVVSVEEMDEPDFKLGRMRRIAIFLSVFDVHVNRSPVDGRVKKKIYKPGEFLDVRHPESSTRNEFLAWSLDTPNGPVAVRQIAGLIARRIVAWAGEGSSLAKGERFGMIRFGSRTEVFIPLECVVLVKPGDRVAGARTPIAHWPK